MRYFKRYVVVKQYDQTDCGAACLATVVKTHGLQVPISRIRQAAGTDARGTTVFGLVQAAHSLGFDAKPARTTLQNLANLPKPFIVHVRVGNLLHFVVVHDLDCDQVVVADPAVGLRRIKVQEFEVIWTGIIILLVPQSDFGRSEDAEPAWRRFLHLLRPHDYFLAECAVLSILTLVLGLAFSQFLRILVDQVIVNKDWTLLRWMGGALLCTVLAKAVLTMMRSLLLAHVSRSLDATIMTGYLRHTFTLPMRFFESRQVGEIIRRFADGVKVREALSGSTLTLLVDGCTAVSMLGLLAFLSPHTTLIVASAIPILLVSTHVCNQALRGHQRQAMEQAAVLESELVENLSGISAVKALRAEDEILSRSTRVIAKVLRALFNTTIWAATTSILGEFILGLAAVWALWDLGIQTLQGAMTTGEAVAFYSILLVIFQPIQRIIAANQNIQDAVVAADRLWDVLDLEPESQGEPIALRLEADEAPQISFDQVEFGYPGRLPLFKNLTFEIPRGQTVGIVGASGSGKSTIAKLLLREYDPDGGAVRINGVDLRDLRLPDLRGLIGLVDQGSLLFNGTIHQNLVLGNPHVDHGTLLGVVRDLGLEPLIHQLPQRFDTPIGSRATMLSGGQRQRLVLARTLLRDPRLLILDEPTSDLDPVTEKEIIQALQRFRGGRTVLIIAHRLSTLAHVDRILVLGEGGVLEDGSHAALLREGGQYAAMWEAGIPLGRGREAFQEMEQ